MTPDHNYQDCVPEEALTALERIHVATGESATLNNMLVRILDEMLEILDCDRVSPDSCRVRARSHMLHILGMYVCQHSLNIDQLEWHQCELYRAWPDFATSGVI